MMILFSKEADQSLEFRTWKEVEIKHGTLDHE